MRRHLPANAAAILLTVFGSSPVGADSAAPPMTKDEAAVVAQVQARDGASDAMARAIWADPELGYLEFNTSKLMKDELAKAGFAVQSGVAGIPTAFVASYGKGGPVIAILAEMDALPGKSQAAVPEKQEIAGKLNNHACGHNLFAAGSVAAAIAVKDWLVANGRPGTVRLYGAPAEEGGSGKVYLVRAGLFKDVDVVLHWHPAMVNAAIPTSDNAVISAKFRFHGKASHAASSPQRGRSALEGVEAMDAMVNMMRQHINDGARISYIITKGGDAPNVVPDFAEVYYYVREGSVNDLHKLFDRVVKAANGAAMGTETTVDYEVIHGTYNNLANETLERVMDANLRKRAADTIRWSPEMQSFAKKLYATIDDQWIPLGTEAEVQPFKAMFIPGSSDVGDVSWNVPTSGLVTTTWVPATDAHSWQATAAGGTEIGFQGMHLAAQAIAMTAVDLFDDPATIAAAKKEFEKARGADFHYAALVGNRAPPLDYRKNPGTSPGE